MNEIQLEQCIKEYGKDIYAFCSQLTRNPQETEDLYQDTFLKAVELGARIDFEQNPRSYLVSIALRIWNKSQQARCLHSNQVRRLKMLLNKIDLF